jgi:hypothetical protein
MLHPNVIKNINLPAANPGIDEGFYLNDLARGDVIELATAHHNYRLVKRADTHVHISGHPMFCPDPIEVEIEGSFGNGAPAKPKPGFIRRGMHLIIKHPVFDLVTTSQIREIHKLS